MALAMKQGKMSHDKSPQAHKMMMSMSEAEMEKMCHTKDGEMMKEKSMMEK